MQGILTKPITRADLAALIVLALTAACAFGGRIAMARSMTSTTTAWRRPLAAATSWCTRASSPVALMKRGMTQMPQS
jgi:hypothetical protein